MKKLILVLLLTFTVGLAPVSAYALEDDILFPRDEVVTPENNCYQLIQELKNIDLQISVLQQRQEDLLEQLGSGAQSSQDILRLLDAIKSLEQQIQEDQQKIEELNDKYFAYLSELSQVDFGSPRYLELQSLIASISIEIATLNEAIETWKNLINVYKQQIANLADLDIARVNEIVKELVDISNKIEDLKKKKAEILRQITSDPACAEMWIQITVLNPSL